MSFEVAREPTEIEDDIAYRKYLGEISDFSNKCENDAIRAKTFREAVDLAYAEMKKEKNNER